MERTAETIAYASSREKDCCNEHNHGNVRFVLLTQQENIFVVCSKLQMEFLQQFSHEIQTRFNCKICEWRCAHGYARNPANAICG